MDVSGGTVKRIACKDAMVRSAIEDVQSTDGWAKRIGEFAFGLNPKARLIPEFLETEKMGGTVHVAFGNNSDYPGGRNLSKTHQDFLISRPTVTVEFKTQKQAIMKDGKFVYK
jgi:aminopeptidase